MDDISQQTREEELQEYGSVLSKQAKDLLHKGLSLGHLNPEQAGVLAEHCVGLVELGTALFHQEAAQ